MRDDNVRSLEKSPVSGYPAAQNCFFFLFDITNPGGTLKIEEGAHPIFWRLKILSDLCYILNTEVIDYDRFADGEEGLLEQFRSEK